MLFRPTQCQSLSLAMPEISYPGIAHIALFLLNTIYPVDSFGTSGVEATDDRSRLISSMDMVLSCVNSQRLGVIEGSIVRG